MTGDFEAAWQAPVHGYGKFHRAIVIVAAHADALLTVVEEILAAGFTFSIGRQRVKNLTRRSLVDHDRFRILTEDALVGDVDLGAESGLRRLQEVPDRIVSQVDPSRAQRDGIRTCTRPPHRRLASMLR
ncbi:hypothetical protein [Stenotrophomonas lactitubi]|uniref:hypothetical protein n=1 Tax=Stenotrophomonas lactitubi TaxID=2045214 RepID=UPI001F06E8BF|nr:hypothetical protein [Stenotrophomonas lactitubi]